MPMKKMTVLLNNQQDQFPLNGNKLIQTAQNILNLLDRADAELSLSVIDDDTMATLNRQYRQRQGPTNVLAFSMREGLFTEIAPQVLGDVIISAQTAERERLAMEISLEERINMLLIHGILHLIGYDHERSEIDAVAMHDKEEALLSLI